MHHIEKFHFMTFFMGSFLPESLMSLKNFDDIYFYTLFLSNELGKYPSFIEDHQKDKIKTI